MRRIVTIAFAASTFMLALSPIASAVIVDGIGIIVNKDAILVSEINQALMPMMQEYRQRYSGKDLEKRLADLRETIIKQAIENKLILQVAKEKGITASDKDIDSRIEIVKSRFPSEDDFLKALSLKGTTYGEFRSEVAEQVLVQQTIQIVLGPDIRVLENEISDYYDAHNDEFVTQPKVKLAQLFLAVPSGAAPDVVEAVRQRAIQLHILIEDGFDFNELAEHYSEGPQGDKGGIIGTVGKNEILPELEEFAFKLNTGEVSPVIETTYGYHILKALEAMPAKKVTFEEAKPAIEERLRETKRSGKYKEWIQGLREKAYIEVKL